MNVLKSTVEKGVPQSVTLPKSVPGGDGKDDKVPGDGNKVPGGVRESTLEGRLGKLINRFDQRFDQMEGELKVLNGVTYEGGDGGEYQP